MIILAVSTSSPRGTVAVARDAVIVSRVAYDGGTSHAERLFAAIDEAMALASVGRGDLDALGCDVGPGSFTGVRVGLASTKGIALALDRPVVPVGALESMAFAASLQAPARDVLAVVDARKGEVFAGVYDAALAPVWGPVHLPRGEVSTLREQAASRDAVAVGEIVVELDGLTPPLRGPAVDLPDAASIALLVDARLRGSSAAEAVRRYDAALLEAAYVRAPDARPMVAP